MENKSPSSSKEARLFDLNFLKTNVTAAFANFVQPIFSVFLSLLAIELGASVLEIGLVGGASSLVYAFMPFVMGRFSDRGQLRRFLIIFSLVLLSLTSTLYYFAQNPIDLIILRLFEGLGWAGLWPSLDSAISHDTRANPKRALAVFNLSWSSTAALGPIVGSFVIVVLSVRDVFLFNAVFLLLALMINLIPFSRFASKKLTETNEEIDPATIPSSGFIKESGPKLSPVFYIFALILSTISFNTTASFFSPYAHSLGVQIVVIGAVSTTYGVARFLGYVLTLNNRISHFLLNPKTRFRNTITFLVFTSLAPLLIILPGHAVALYYVSFVMIGLSWSLVYFIALISFVAETSKETMGSGAGIFETSIGIGNFTGPVVAGLVAGNSLTTPFIVPTILSIPILAFLGTKKPRKVRKSSGV